MRKIEIIILGIILLSFITGIYFYPQMPEKIASHWNVYGNVDGYMSKCFGLFLMPFLSIGLFFLFILIPKIDPLKENIDKFKKYFDKFVILLMVYLFYIYLLTIFWNIGIKFNIVGFMVPALGILFYYSGVLIENSKRNWFIGIKTPWTLSSETVWNETHKIGGKLFKIAGIISILGIFFPKYALFFVLVPIILSSIYTIVYSYLQYKKQRDS